MTAMLADAHASHPLSLTMWASSMMNLPSLYFWLDSNACSCKPPISETDDITRYDCNYVFPAESGFAALAVDVGHCVQTGEKDSLLGRTAAHIHPKAKRLSTWSFLQQPQWLTLNWTGKRVLGFPGTTNYQKTIEAWNCFFLFCVLKGLYLGNEFIMTGQVSPTMDARVGAMAVFWEVRLERFHHLARFAADARLSVWTWNNGNPLGNTSSVKQCAAIEAVTLSMGSLNMLTCTLLLLGDSPWNQVACCPVAIKRWPGSCLLFTFSRSSLGLRRLRLLFACCCSSSTLLLWDPNSLNCKRIS